MPVRSLAAALAALALNVSAAVAAPAPDARAFTARAEGELAAAALYASKAAWVQATYITDDTDWLASKADGELTELRTRLAVEAARYDGAKADPATRRKLDILKRAITQPAPQRPGAAGEIATLSTRLGSAYSTGKFAYGGKTLTLNDAEDVLAKSRDPAALKAVWEGWRTVSPPMREDYVKLTALMNEGARGLNYADTGALWRSGYDMTPKAFAAKTDALWLQLEPFYRNLHCYVRARLNDRYGDAVQPRTGPIRADLLGNMWSQDWSHIYDVVQPKGAAPAYDLDTLLVAQGYDAQKMVRAGEGFYSSLGFAPLPDSFWTRSQFVRPRDREVVCHASAWDVDDKQDLRVKMCIKINGEDFFTVHHELGHNYYQRAYSDQPYIFRDGANDGFHEAIGDFAGLYALTPSYLKTIGLLDQVPGDDADIPFLMQRALDKIAFLPFGLMVDRWRWQVFSGQTPPKAYNDDWWALARRYQGIAPPGPRPADAFDPGAKYHVAATVPYTRYFLATIYQFQFYRAACRQIGWQGPLNRCSIYGDKAVGARFEAMLRLGASRPWPDALEAFTGERDIDASAVTDYFAPLNAWLIRQNGAEQCGW